MTCHELENGMVVVSIPDVHAHLGVQCKLPDGVEVVEFLNGNAIEFAYHADQLIELCIAVVNKCGQSLEAHNASAIIHSSMRVGFFFSGTATKMSN